MNNLWDEEARLALDYERGRSAPSGLSHQPAAHVWRVGALGFLGREARGGLRAARLGSFQFGRMKWQV